MFLCCFRSGIVPWLPPLVAAILSAFFRLVHSTGWFGAICIKFCWFFIKVLPVMMGEVITGSEKGVTLTSLLYGGLRTVCIKVLWFCIKFLG